MPPEFRSWLARHGLERHAESFERADVDLDVIGDLSDADFEKLGLSIGDRQRVRRAVKAAATDEAALPAQVPVEAAADADVEAGERRHLSVVFCDLVDSTALAARLDPEDVREVVSADHDLCAEVVRAHGGEVAQFLGDGVMMQFGFPHAHEDDAERSVRCALEVIARMRSLQLPGDVRLVVRAGIATGTEVIGDLGNQSRDRASVVGVTPSRAARLQSVAEPGTVVIAEATRRLLGDAFSLVALGKHELKGLGDVELWRVDAALSGTSRFAAHHATLNRFVGRETEFALLDARFGLVRGGEGQAVVLSADAGVGKSRIVEEFATAMGTSEATRIQLQCSPHFSASALHPVREFVERDAGIASGDLAAERAEKLAAYHARTGMNALPEASAAIATLLDVAKPDDDAGLGAATAQQRKNAIFEAVIGQIVARASERPVLFIVEDLHWIDPTTLELLSRAIDVCAERRVLFVLTCRPEFVSPWSHYPHVTAMQLNRLARSSVETMVRDLSADRELEPALIERIVARADGVALFVEELTKSIVESAARSGDGEIPETLRDALSARLDALPDARGIAQIGSVIGREFSEEMLVEISQRREEDVRPELERLVGAGLLLRRGSMQGTTYAFKHALVRDAAYDGILRTRRRHLHLRVARAIVDRFPALADGEPESVATHFEEGDAFDDAVTYRCRAADRALLRSGYAEALVNLQRAIDLVHRSGGDAQRELAISNALGVVHCVLEGPRSSTARSCYERSWSLAAGLPESRETFIALWGVCFCEYMGGLARQALAKADDLIALADRLGEPDLLLEALHVEWAAALTLGDMTRALATTERGITVYEPDLHHAHVVTFGSGHDAGICGFGHSAMANAAAGHAVKARAAGASIRELSARVDHPFTACTGSAQTAIALYVLGDFLSASEMASAFISTAKERKFAMPIALGLLIEGGSRIELGDVAVGRALLEEVLAAESLPAAFRPLGESMLARHLVAIGNLEGAIRRLEDAERAAEMLGGCFAGAEIERAWGALESGRGSTRAAMSRYDRAVDDAEHNGATLLALRAAVDRAELAAQAVPERAADTCTAVRRIIAAMDDATEIADVTRALTFLAAGAAP